MCHCPCGVSLSPEKLLSVLAILHVWILCLQWCQWCWGGPSAAGCVFAFSKLSSTYLFHEVGLQVSSADDIAFSSRASIKKKKKLKWWRTVDPHRKTFFLPINVFPELEVCWHGNKLEELYDVLHCELGAFFKASVQISYYFDGGLNWCFCDIKIDRATVTTNNFRLSSVNCTYQYKLACKNKKSSARFFLCTHKKITTSHTHCVLHLRYLPYLYFFSLSVHWVFIKQSNDLIWSVTEFPFFFFFF